ncbi:histidinol-phosphatase [Sphingomonas endophytica]|jgi:histidinol phosphatase-like enzyme (inositol monophosphatase family)|uniref:Histidinol phosphatase-like enzyme (Inositol monophosphatase family) n=1 Tax=Sphingomonas endophytica TaxID=869719 RepID=A0A7X0JBX5_9SPHN|nr:inositol monophosphatase family protein [Sphingomonas endophytica]MBB5726393.1 histidinol phosphatase-like enzyme (inositol monophosphatase family) [Sphingomonas endophytica]MBB6504794.1 histidinol phosphatase-like enzyme (inositol monophosphatase family) [Sphingomonas endophytica]
MPVRPADIALAHRLADAAGAVIRPYFRQPAGLELKEDRSPVTRADREAEEAMRRLLDAECPGDGVVGEEHGVKDGVTGRQWVLDPIDGTRSFTAGRAIFGTLIALVEDGWPVLGIIDQPVQRERWTGVTGRPTLLNDAPVRTRACAALEGAIVATTSPHLFEDADVPHFMALVAAASGGAPRQGPVYGGDCYNYGLLASGFLDIVCESGLQLYDFAALAPIVEGAGGRMCDWNGDPLTADSAGHVLAIGDPARADEVLEALRNVAGHDHHDH